MLPALEGNPWEGRDYVYAEQAKDGILTHADFMTMAVFIWRYGQEPSPTQPTFIAPGPVGSFGTDEAGELYLLTYAEQGGSVYRFVADEESTPPADFPQTLSETGCFASVPDLIPGGDLVPYELNVSFWSDTAQKRRYLVLPEGTEMVASGDGQWDYPAGTLAIKHFELPPLSSAAEDGAQRLETRFLVYEGDGQIRGYTYRWNDAGDEAFLLTGAETQIVTVEPSPAEFVDDHHWQYPSRTQCGGCHTAAAGGLLGLESGQLNRMVSVDGQMRHQFDVLGELYRRARLRAAPALAEAH